MKKIIWSDEFSVGVGSLDSQHKNLIRIFNKLIEKPYALVDSETISDTLSEMTKYAFQHFELEEKLMEDSGYPYLEQHKAQHRSFRIKTIKFCSAATQHIDEVPDILLNYLGEWWVTHILSEDMGYRSLFIERGIV